MTKPMAMGMTMTKAARIPPPVAAVALRAAKPSNAARNCIGKGTASSTRPVETRCACGIQPSS